MAFFEKLIDVRYSLGMGISGLTDESFGVYLYNLLRKENKNILVVVNSLYEANKLYKILQSYTDDVYLFPMDDFLTSEAIAISPELKITRLETINSTFKNKNKIVITNLMGYLRYLPSKKIYKKAIKKLEIGSEISPNKLIEKLVDMGYTRESIVTNTGEFAVRGFIIDVFPIGEEYPIRIEFFGDEIDSIRSFNSETQHSYEKKKEVILFPYTEFITDNGNNSALDKQKNIYKYCSEIQNISGYLEKSITVYKDYSQLEVGYETIANQIVTYKKEKDKDYKGSYMFELDQKKDINCIYCMSLNNKSHRLNDDEIVNYDIKTIDNFNENEQAIIAYFRREIEKRKTIVILLDSKNKINAIKKINYPIYETDIENIKENKVNLVHRNMIEGFEYNNYIFISAKELFKNQISHKKYKTNFKYGSKIKNLNMLKTGDYVVHNAHGIGIYNGIKVLKSANLEKDYIEVLYAGKDKLYIPVEKIDLLHKYVGKEGISPKISKMDGIDWKKTKSRVKQKVADMADKLIRLYAQREKCRGFAFSKDSHLQKQFEDECPFTLTTDQSIAVNQIKEDMEKITPMDRLLCGDVGFGKTEVAFRAVFKAILDSKQVLFLCPTTILSSQHYDNALTRFKNFPVNIALLNRFTTTSEVKRIKEQLKNGTIDVVFGTHRLLSSDIDLKNLGLLIIDEEQRFGVAHKEKIKEYKTNVDVLTLTATPIPRTLQMSMVGIRSLSLIETPPINRYPIQTYVVEENNILIKDAIYKEISRNGQVYILYNSVAKIEDKVDEIKKLVPDAKVSFAHGQMTKEQLEKQMFRFINKEFDILVCTTIIETGIDIPNVNTLIILDADRFGLSQLYQIRGRVGRSDKFAYAYLMYNSNKILTETAQKRLNVIKEFTELGSGFSIATRDLSIRGAGDILGSEQAGFIDTVGIDLYLKLLEEEILRKNGQEVLDEDMDNEPPAINVATHIDDSYVSDESVKIEIHKKINEIDCKEKLNNIKAELEDRFGNIDEKILIYMYEEWFEKQLKKASIKKVNQTKNYIELVFQKDIVQKLDIDDLFIKAFAISRMFRFKSRGTSLVIILDTIRLDRHPLYYLTELMQYILEKFL